MSDIELLERREIFAGKVLDLRVDRVRLPNGRSAELEIAHHPGAVAIVAVTEDAHALLVRQYRYAVRGWVLEVPAGKLEKGEEPEACARRELEEETGFAAQELIALGWIWSSPGFTDERIGLFLARGLDPTRQKLQADEALSVVSMPFAEAVAAARNGKMEDGKSVCALLRAAEVVSSSAVRRES